MTEKLTTLAKRLRPFLAGQIQAMAGAGVLMTEGPDIDIVGQAIGRGGDTILLFDSGGNPLAEYPATSAGLVNALAAATSGDAVDCPMISVALTAGITVPISVTLRNAILTFSGFAGTAITLSNYATIKDSSITYTKTGADVARGILTAKGSTVNHTNMVVSGGTGTSIAIDLANGANAVNDYVTCASSYGNATGAELNVGIVIRDYTRVTNSWGDADNGTTGSYGISGAMTVLGNLTACHGIIGRASGTNSYGLRAADNLILYCTSGTGYGDNYGLKIETGATAYLCNVHWSSLSNSGTLTYLQGDRGAYSVEDYHANDIEAAALTRHNPLPGASGNVVTSDGTNWTSQAPGTALAGTILGYIVVYEDEVATLDGEVVWLI